MILEATASRYRGYCANCYRSHGLRAWLVKIGQFIGAMILLVFFLLSLPFMLAWLSIQKAIRTRRFPFDRPSLLAAIQHVHPNDNDGRCYLKGVIDGYWEASPKRRFHIIESAYAYGCVDGEKLRRGEIDVSDIPSHRSPFLPPAHIPGARYRTGEASHSQPGPHTFTPSTS
ncbi:hypothetical protein [Roseimicrobium sp. ORNL1]|uniref:hypothetical protein n=1 Tax=Roseimicrobium sp. ORNL1 TaxID=2711231 RepID=UPI0013E2065D|nr:hypothetical protein [Roseimicrobium sp. ORNL1]QIF00361.1 hypothetical protein G5S37_02080 [Roseimicrobium sp. ORNL1]